MRIRMFPFQPGVKGAVFIRELRGSVHAAFPRGRFSQVFLVERRAIRALGKFFGNDFAALRNDGLKLPVPLVSLNHVFHPL